MNSTIFDDITRAFVTTLEAGTLSLGAYSPAAPRGLCAHRLVLDLWAAAGAWAAAQMGDALAAALLYAVNIGVAYWLLVNLSGMATAAYQTFLQWGLAAGGGADRRAAPHALGGGRYGLSDCRAAHGLCRPANGLDVPCGISRRFSCMTSPPRRLCVAFPFVALALMVTQIEYHLAVMLGAVLIPVWHLWPDRLSHGVLYRLDHRAVCCASS